MPIGVIINVTAVVLGSLTGTIAGKRLSDNLKETMNAALGLCALCMGISAVVLMKNLPAVVFSVILGTLVGLALKLGLGIRRASGMVLDKVMQNADAQAGDLMLTAVVLFCASGTGIYGALDAGMIFTCQLGKAAAFIGIPQFVVLFSLFCLAKVIVPLTTDVMIADFKACGGFILVATGLRMLKVNPFPIADMLPAMVLVMPVSFLWTTFLLPMMM